MVQLRPLQSPVLVGRDDLLALAERRLAEAADGRGRLLLLAGEAGIGKTRLLHAVLRKAVASGFRVAKGDLAPQDRLVPLASILDLARTLRGVPAFGGLGRELLELPGSQGGDSLGSRRLLVHDIADRIVASVDGPTLLAFEDLQWADELSIEVIGELARRAVDRPLMLLASYRLDELPTGSVHREWRARLLSQRLAEEVRPERLSYDQTAVVTTLILGTGLPAPREAVAAIHERTNGIPLHIEELLAALGDDGPPDARTIRDAIVPDTIEDAVLARAGRLSDDALAVARAGAVIGRCFIPEVLAGVLDRPLRDLDDPLAELVASGILYPFDFLDRGFYDFRHQLLRDALYGSVPHAELRRFHARAAEFGGLIEGASEIHASVHFERAGMRAQAYRAALAGARAASRVSSRQEAFELYQRAVANAPDDLEPLELAALHAERCEAAMALDRVDIGLRSASIARDLYLTSGRPLEAASMLLEIANAAAREARAMDARNAPLEQAAREIAELPMSPERAGIEADLLLMQGINDLNNLDLDGAQNRFLAARRIAQQAGMAASVADADFLLGSADILAGNVAQGIDATLDVARRSREAAFESAGVTAYRNVTVLATRVLDYATAEGALREGLRYADEIEQSYCRHMMRVTSAWVDWAAGRWDEAVARAEQELVEPGSRRPGLGARDVLGYVAFGRGDVDRARALLDESLAVAHESGEPGLLLSPLWGLAEAALVAGEAPVAVECCESSLAIARESGERALLVPFVVSGVRAYLLDRRPDAAERWLAQVRTLLERWTTIAGPALDHADGLIRLSEGSIVLARSALERAVAGWDDRGRAWEAAWARLDLAGCLARVNRHADSMRLIAEVEQAAERLGSRPLQDRIRDLAPRVRARGAETEPWRPLTAREFEIARLVAEGMTNGAIAEDLGLSPRTVGAHVEHILAKLGATRRAEIAAWVSAVRPATVARDDDRVAGGRR